MLPPPRAITSKAPSRWGQCPRRGPQTGSFTKHLLVRAGDVIYVLPTHRDALAVAADGQPLGDGLTTVTLRDLGRGRRQVRWSATFEADGLPAQEAAVLLEGALAANCVALKQFMEVGWR